MQATSNIQIAEVCKKARAELKRAAVESIQYVALGKVMRRDLAEKYGLPESKAGDILCLVCRELTDEINGL